MREEDANGGDTAINSHAAAEASAQAIEAAGSGTRQEAPRAPHSGTFALITGQTRHAPGGDQAEPRAILYEYQPVGQPCRRIEMAPAAP